jgi:hypothetical protein
MRVGCQSLAAAAVEAAVRSCRAAASRPSLHVDLDDLDPLVRPFAPPSAVRRVRCWRGPLCWASHAARTDVEASGYCKRAISSAAKLTTHTSTFGTLRSWAMAASVPLSGFGLATQTATTASTSAVPSQLVLEYRQCSESPPRAWQRSLCSSVGPCLSRSRYMELLFTGHCGRPLRLPPWAIAHMHHFSALTVEAGRIRILIRATGKGLQASQQS